MIPFFKKSAVKLALACAVILAPAVEAAQPIVWTLNLTNTSLAASAVNTTGSNNLTGTYWTGTGGQVNSNYIDCLQANTGTIVAYVNPGPANVTNVVNGGWQFYFIGSPDMVSWYAYTNLAVNSTQTNTFTGAYLPISMVPFRYLAITNVMNTQTNAFLTNALQSITYTTNSAGIIQTNGYLGLRLQLMIKGP